MKKQKELINVLEVEGKLIGIHRYDYTFFENTFSNTIDNLKEVKSKNKMLRAILFLIFYCKNFLHFCIC